MHRPQLLQSSLSLVTLNFPMTLCLGGAGVVGMWYRSYCIGITILHTGVRRDDALVQKTLVLGARFDLGDEVLDHLFRAAELRIDHALKFFVGREQRQPRL